MSNSLYAWASGSNVALVSLNNIEAEIQTHPGNWPILQALTEFVFSPPINPFPNRLTTMDGRLTSEGKINHYLEITGTEESFQYQLDTYLSGGADLDAPITIYLRQKGRTGADKWARYNCLLTYPDSDGESGDIIYQTNGVIFVRWQLRDLILSS